MRRLMEDFDRLFDLGFDISGRPLRNWLEEAIADLDANALPDWATPGEATRAASEQLEAVRFRYLPHLFPQMELKLRLAHMLQFHMLPRDLPPASAIKVSAVLESYCHMSGDLFGWERVDDDQVLLWIVDISGHGVRSGLASAILKVIIGLVEERNDTAALVVRLNEALCACTRRDGTAVYATGAFLLISESGAISYTSAGHPPGMIRRQDGTIHELGANSIPIGLFPGTSYERDSARLSPGDLLVLATDGLFEMVNEEGRPFGIEGLRAFLRSTTARRTTELTDSLYAKAGSYKDLTRLDDDLSFVAARLGESQS